MKIKTYIRSKHFLYSFLQLSTCILNETFLINHLLGSSIFCHQRSATLCTVTNYIFYPVYFIFSDSSTLTFLTFLVHIIMLFYWWIRVPLHSFCNISKYKLYESTCWWDGAEFVILIRIWSFADIENFSAAPHQTCIKFWTRNIFCFQHRIFYPISPKNKMLSDVKKLAIFFLIFWKFL